MNSLSNGDSRSLDDAPFHGFLALATAKSFGDFVIAHSVLHRIDAAARNRLRLIANSHVRELNAILPDDVCVTLVESEAAHVPALFDIKKRGAVAAVRSALSLRREFRKISRRDSEALMFAGFGVRERFIAGRWPVLAPRQAARNIYETYFELLAEHGVKLTLPFAPMSNGKARSVGVFPESRLLEKRLNDTTLTMVSDRAKAAGLEVRLFILEGDLAAERLKHPMTRIPRNFESLAAAIKSVDCVLSADSLPAHLAEYFDRPTFVALPAANEYWMPFGCFVEKRWGVFADRHEFYIALDEFFAVAADCSRPSTGR
jgi:ADP-heptose:LPS heptosyltransferase